MSELPLEYFTLRVMNDNWPDNPIWTTNAAQIAARLRFAVKQQTNWDAAQALMTWLEAEHGLSREQAEAATLDGVLKLWREAHASAGVQMGGTGHTENEPASMALTTEDEKILRALAGGKTTADQYQLEEETGLSRRTISGRLKFLRDEGLVHRPRGPRKGEALTPKGRALIAR